MIELVTPETSRTAESLIRDLERLRGSACPTCGGELSHRHALMSIAMGFKDAPRCLPCLGVALGSDLTALRGQLLTYIQRQDCFRGAWGWACRTEGVEVDDCHDSNHVPPMRGSVRPGPQASPKAPAVSGGALEVHAEWDAGDMGCGELVLELRLRLQALQPGQIFKLCARDPGAPEDLPAWCRLTGHLLAHAEPPNYWIKRKD